MLDTVTFARPAFARACNAIGVAALVHRPLRDTRRQAISYPVALERGHTLERPEDVTALAEFTFTCARVWIARVVVLTEPAGSCGTLSLLTLEHLPSGARSAADAVAFSCALHVLFPAGQYEVKRVCTRFRLL